MTTPNKTAGVIWQATQNMPKAAAVDFITRALDQYADACAAEKVADTKYCPCYTYVDGNTDPDCPMHGTRGKSLKEALDRLKQELLITSSPHSQLARDIATVSAALSAQSQAKEEQK